MVSVFTRLQGLEAAFDLKIVFEKIYIPNINTILELEKL